jgi:hypothetical protein
MSDVLHEILDLSRGRRPRLDVSCEVVRPLTEEDLPALDEAPQAVARQRLDPDRMRYVHQRLAQLVALGTKNEVISGLMGYSESYISSIKNDPTFQGLVAHYAENAQLGFVDAAQRLQMFGLSAVEELQKRLDSEPEAWTKKELMDAADMAIAKPLAAQRNQVAGSAGGTGLNINIKFVEPQSPKAVVIEHDAGGDE